MAGGFSSLDWLIVGSYLALPFGLGWYFGGRKPKSSRDYFLAGNNMPIFVVTVSVLATTQSAATFLGGPDQGFRGDFSYVSANISALLGSLFVAYILIPRFYKHNSATVYEILEKRFSTKAMKGAGLMYLIGRLFASGSRLYLAAIAVAMILFSNIEADSIILSSLLMITIGFLLTFLGGIRSVLWSDLIQFLIYVFAALTVIYFLLSQIPATGVDILEGLRHAPNGQNKLQFFNFDMDFSNPWAMISIFSGLTLLYIGSFGLDQDITQRLLTCKNGQEGGRALLYSALVGIPVIFLFVAIGQLLYVFYERPDLMGDSLGVSSGQNFQGADISIFMQYILNEMPVGLRGLVTVGVIAAAISTINSGLNSMSSVLIQDFYKPWKKSREDVSERHFVRASQLSMALVGGALFLMSVLCYYWQNYTNMPLLDFALSVMVFAYSGLLGVYFTVVFTSRGSTTSVLWALGIGFLTTLLQQTYIVDLLGLPESWKGLAFSWQLLIGTSISFGVCQLGNNNKVTS